MTDIVDEFSDGDGDRPEPPDQGLAYMGAGWGVFPLPPRAKYPPPVGVTGHGATDLGGADYMALRDEDEYRDGNIGIRPPDTVIGLDVDAYPGKPGGETLAHLESLCGPLPATWRSSARDDSVSGIRFFRVPAGIKWEGIAGAGIEVIQRNHRYAVAPPSQHPSAGRYRWTRPDGTVAVGAVPAVADLPELPETWVQRLRKGVLTGTESVEAVAASEANEWLAAFDNHVVCGVMRSGAERHINALGNLDGSSAHDELVSAYTHLCRLAMEGHLGVLHAAKRVQKAFLAEVTSDRRGHGGARRLTERAARVESRQVMRWVVGMVKDEVHEEACVCSERQREVDATVPRTRIPMSSELATIRNVRTALGTGSLQAVFRQGGQLVWVPSMQSGTWTSGNVVQPLPNKHSLQSLLIQHAFVFTTDDDGEPHEAAVPRQWLDTIVHDVASLPNVRDIEEVITSPTLAADGTVIQTPGYHDGVLYLPGDDYAGIAVPDSPTKSEARAATATIVALIEEFPFTSLDARANYLALMLAPLIRRLLHNPLPLAVFSAPAKGSGKSLLAQGLIALHGGTLIPGWPSPEELPKKITTELMAPGAVKVFDNVRSKVAGESLEALLTSARHRDRVMGSQRYVDLPNNCLWGVTSNNATIGDDIARRMIAVEIDPKVERPYERTGFKITNWEQHIIARREELLSALLTMVRYALSLGAPAPAQRSDSFAGFVALTQHVLTSCGVRGTVMSAESIETVSSPDSDDITDFLLALADVEDDGSFKSGEWFTLKELMALVGGVYTLHTSDAVARLQEECKAHGMTRRGDLNPKVLGGWLSQWKNYVTSGLHLESRRRHGRGNIREWRLVRREA